MFYLNIARNIDALALKPKLQKQFESQNYKNDAETIWRELWKSQSDEAGEDALFNSLQKTFQGEWMKAILMQLLYYQLTILVPVLAYYIFRHILDNTYNAPACVVLVAIIILIKLVKPFLRVCAEERLRQIGEGMYEIITRAVVNKTLQISLLSNPEVSGSQLLKMMQTDMEKIISFPQIRSSMIANFYGLIFSLIMIIVLFGIAGLIGVVVLITITSIRFCLRKKAESFEEQLARETEIRVEKTVQMLHNIKFIKVGALEVPQFLKLWTLREKELDVLHAKNKWEILPVFIISVVLRLAIFTVCVSLIAFGTPIDAAIMFTLNNIIIFNNFYVMMNGFVFVKEIKVSVAVIDAFLRLKEIDSSHITRSLTPNKQAISVRKGNFYWKRSQEQGKTQDRIWLHDVELSVSHGELIGVVGRYGSGKTSLIQALLGEMRDAGGSRVALNGSIAYAAQKQWILSGTVRENILFDAPFEPKRYQTALHFSCLHDDLKMLSDGDQTLIGERGCTLSGGQKARVALARALYADADIILLDDILSAVDAHVGAFLFNQTLRGYLRGKTVMLITHALNFVQQVDRVLLMDEGRIVANGPFQQLKGHPLLKQIQINQKQHLTDKIISKLAISGDIKKVNEELLQIAEQQQIFLRFMELCGGTKFKVFASVILLVCLLTNIAITIWMNVWANSPDQAEGKYSLIYVILMAATSFSFLYLFYYILHLPILAKVYKSMLWGTLLSPLTYFESTSTARILQRMAGDLKKLDKVVLLEFFAFFSSFILVFVCALCNFFAYFKARQYGILIFFVLFLGLLYYQYRKYFIASQTHRHSEDELRIPINTYYSQIVQGQTTIRACNKVTDKELQLNKIQQQSAAVRRIGWSIDSLIYFWLSIYCTIFLTFLLIFYFFTDFFNEYHVFILFNVIMLEEVLMRTNMHVLEFLDKLKCLTKCEELSRLQPEKGFKELPSSMEEEDEGVFSRKMEAARQMNPFGRGQVEFRNLSVAYRPELGDALRNLSFSVRAGEKVGIVGRTGSGKSTLLLALLRIVELRAGTIFIDGLDYTRFDLSSLRANVTVILQEHFLFAGTVRANLDPSHEHSDEAITHSLNLCGIWERLRRKQGLDTGITQGGENLSVGQRQLLNIARALLRKRKLVLVDEATASVDAQTDAEIQRVLQTHFADSTVLTVAHRLSSVAHCDRILVLENGQVREFDSPSALLERKDSLYRQLYEQA